MKWLDIPTEHRAGRQCASDRCDGQPVAHFEHGGVGSDYCAGCVAKIEAHVRRWDALPRELLPRMPGAEVIIVCPSCQTRWAPEDERCQNCGRGVDEPVQ